VRLYTEKFSKYKTQHFDGDFLTIAKKWEAVFGKENLICKVYDARQNNIISEFLSCCQISAQFNLESQLPIYKENNKSLGIALLTLKRLFNISNNKSNNNYHIELPEIARKLFECNDIPAILMTSKETKNFRKKFNKINKSFSKRYLKKKISDFGKRRYTDQERDKLYKQCKDLINI